LNNEIKDRDTETLMDEDGIKQFAAQMSAQIPPERVGDPGEIAKAVVFLVSSAASYITGVDRIVDVGMTAVSSYSVVIVFFREVFNGTRCREGWCFHAIQFPQIWGCRVIAPQPIDVYHLLIEVYHWSLGREMLGWFTGGLR
jgi:hypothetical protein